MSKYQVRLNVNGRQTIVEVRANDAGAAREIAKGMFGGQDVTIIETRRIYE